MSGRLSANPTVNLLWTDFIELNLRWRVYRSLFAYKERFELFHSCSGVVRTIFDDALWDLIVLGVCRLTDPIRSGRGGGERRNVSLQSLLEDAALAPHRHRLGPLIDEARIAAQPFRENRDKRIAHTDHQWRTGNLDAVGLSRLQVREILRKIFEPIRISERLLFDCDVLPGAVWDFDRDEVHFLNILRLGMEEYARLTQKLFESADIQSYHAAVDDLHGPVWLRDREPDFEL